MSERFTLAEMGPVITSAMRAARNDELEQQEPFVRGLHIDCVYPGCPFPAWPHHSHTMYEDVASNWHLLCDAHAAEDDAEWNERWNELNADIAAGIAAGMAPWPR